MPPSRPRGFSLQDAQEDRLRMLCELVENEPDLEKLLELVHEINTLAEARLNRSTSADTTPEK
jgi:hypothetical protein